MPFSWAAASWLARRDPERLRVDWDAEDLPDRLAAFLPRFVPLLEEQARVDANVPFRDYVDAARGADPDAAWLVGCLAALPYPDSVKAELWEATGLQLSWQPRPTDSRGLARFPSPAPFCTDAPLLSRRDVSVAAELAAPPPTLVRLSRPQGAALLDAARAAMAVRYRELPAFSAGDPSAVFRADVGRGVSIFVTGLARDERLPLRAGFGTLFARNGVLVGYGDLHAAFSRADVSFNVFYAFRDGESAWLYARLLAVVRAVTGAAQLSVDPYQIGLGNEEAIASGAFWFYRKLGFRSADPSLERLATPRGVSPRRLPRPPYPARPPPPPHHRPAPLRRPRRNLQASRHLPPPRPRPRRRPPPGRLRPLPRRLPSPRRPPHRPAPSASRPSLPARAKRFAASPRSSPSCRTSPPGPPPTRSPSRPSSKRNQAATSSPTSVVSEPTNVSKPNSSKPRPPFRPRTTDQTRPRFRTVENRTTSADVGGRIRDLNPCYRRAGGCGGSPPALKDSPARRPLTAVTAPELRIWRNLGSGLVAHTGFEPVLPP